MLTIEFFNIQNVRKMVNKPMLGYWRYLSVLENHKRTPFSPIFEDIEYQKLQLELRFILSQISIAYSFLLKMHNNSEYTDMMRVSHLR